MSKLSMSEKKGLLVLSSILLVAFIIQLIQPYYIKEDLYDYSVQDSIFKMINSDTLLRVINKAEKPSEKPEAKKIKSGNIITSLDSININTASQQELEKLPRIGPATARNIVEYRERNGSFKSIEELLKVKRVGAKTLELIKPYIYIEK